MSDGRSGSSVSNDDLQSMLVRKLIEQLNHDSSPPLMGNKEEQGDELVALEAIYTKSFQLLHAKYACSFVLSVHVAMTEPIEVTLEIENTPYSFAVENLPPFHLACSYPSGYPSSSPPVFVLHCSWLSTKKLQTLAETMDQMWNGGVVVYEWSEFLQTRALDCIGMADKLVLEAESCELDLSLKVISGCTSPEDTAATLMAYNEDMQLETFRTSLHTCEICFTEHAGMDFIKLPCDHAYCRSCMKQYTGIHVTDGSVNKLNCPDNACNGGIPPYVLKELLEEEAFERWEKISLQRSLDEMEDIVYCPRCYIACIEDTVGKDAQCTKCLYSFCTLCHEARHTGQECTVFEDQLELFKDRSKKNTSEEQRRKFQNRMNDMLSMHTILQETIPCPTCKMAIEKTEGCNKVKCANCNGYLCYRCGAAISSYDHFRIGACMLFTPPKVMTPTEREQIVRDHEQVLKRNHEQNKRLERCKAIKAELEKHPELKRICIHCGQANAKVGNNNHMCCWSCKGHFCGACYQGVKRAVDHFGPNKCKQHTHD